MRYLLIGLAGIFVISFFSTNYIFLYLPAKNGDLLIPINIVYFLTSIGFCLASGLSLVLYSASFIFERKKRLDSTTLTQRPKIWLRKALRRSLEITALVVSFLLLRLLGIANPINILLLLLVVGLVETYFSSSNF